MRLARDGQENMANAMARVLVKVALDVHAKESIRQSALSTLASYLERRQDPTIKLAVIYIAQKRGESDIIRASAVAASGSWYTESSLSLLLRLLTEGADSDQLTVAVLLRLRTYADSEWAAGEILKFVNLGERRHVIQDLAFLTLREFVCHKAVQEFLKSVVQKTSQPLAADEVRRAIALASLSWGNIEMPPSSYEVPARRTGVGELFYWAQSIRPARRRLCEGD
jgi:hypothetical protein